MNLENLTLLAIQASIKAGKEILRIYDGEFEVEKKADNSPLTIADKNANDIITSFLEKTEYPILSEEGRDIPYEERKNWEYFWMVDPLDGTKEFVKRNGDFTVNIALIHKNEAIMGVIYVPVTDELYFGGEQLNAYKIKGLSTITDLHFDYLTNTQFKLPLTSPPKDYTIVASRSHMNQETKEYIEELKKKYGTIQINSRGSSLKICMVSEGIAQEYPRFAPTMEWDIAAGNAIISGVGMQILDYSTGSRIRFNKKNLLNNWFIVNYLK